MIEFKEFLNLSNPSSLGGTVELWQDAEKNTWLARWVGLDFAGETRNEAINRLIDHLEITAARLELFRDRRDPDDTSDNTCNERSGRPR